MNKIIFLIPLVLFSIACSEATDSGQSKPVSKTEQPKRIEAISTKRWYTDEQVVLGQQLFAQTCAGCHGQQAQGLAEDWRKADADGNYPPPPLNGSAHAWHHPLAALKHSIREGGAEIGGRMPAFKSVYNDSEIEAIIASFQHYWSDEIYQRWQQRNQ